MHVDLPPWIVFYVASRYRSHWVDPTDIFIGYTNYFSAKNFADSYTIPEDCTKIFVYLYGSFWEIERDEDGEYWLGKEFSPEKYRIDLESIDVYHY